MKHILLLLSLIYSSLIASDIYVDGYSRADGTYVEGYHRSSPNDTVSDNYNTYQAGSSSADDDELSYTTLPATVNVENNDNTGLIVLGAIGGLVLFFIILKVLGKFMFISYLAANAKVAFWTWVILTIVNQIVFFGACLAPYCILASIPHVSIITLGIMYLSYATARDTYDPQTGYNKDGYNKDGYDQYGYSVDGYDKNGYNSQDLDRDSKDRLGKGSIGSFFAGSEYQVKISKMNEEARKAKEAAVAEVDAKLEAFKAENRAIIAELRATYLAD